MNTRALLVVFACTALGWCPDVLSAEATQSRVSQARSAAAQGDMSSALNQLRSLETDLSTVDDARLRSETRALLSEIYLQLGNLRGAEQQLPDVADLDNIESSDVLRALGNVYLELGAYDDAMAALDASVRAARERADYRTLVPLLTQRATLNATLSEHEAAVADLLEAQGHLPPGSAQVDDLRLNVLRVRTEQRQWPELLAGMDTLLARFERAASAPDAVQAITLIDIALDAGSDIDLPPALRARLLVLARALPPGGTEASFRFGLEAELLRLSGERRTAISATRRALLLAQAAGRPEISYRWEWLLARLHRDDGNLEAALAASTQALASLGEVQTELLTGNPYRFRSTVGDVYFDHADILLQVAAAAPAETRPQHLRAARAAVERLKVAEIQDYLGADCTRGITSTATDGVAADVAIIYPIVFRDRIELLVSTGGTINRFRSPYLRSQLIDTVNEFRELVQDDTTPEDEIIELGEILFEPLVAPWLDSLPGEVTTLVFVPDDILRTIPMGALHDGDRFLIQRYDIAITPGLALTESSAAGLPAGAYVGGISKARAVEVGRVNRRQISFVALNSVPAEVSVIGEMFAAQPALDEPFLTATLENELAGGTFSVVHIASHGVFGRDPQASFILTWDRYLSMNRLGETLGLRRYTNEPLDLLVLSACETAVGDERAALGLAGVAVNAGARSAVASLWPVNDAATGRLMANFYTGMRRDSLGKARALSRAKNELLDDPVYSHPAYWAPFLLIGNWK